MEKTKNNQNPERPSLSKYDALTNKSTSNILVVNNERGVIQDYVDYLATNNNPYGMFWIHYNNIRMFEYILTIYAYICVHYSNNKGLNIGLRASLTLK